MNYGHCNVFVSRASLVYLDQFASAINFLTEGLKNDGQRRDEEYSTSYFQESEHVS